MELRDPGLDDWLADRARESCNSDLGIAWVTTVDRTRYLVRDGEGEMPAELTGRLRVAAESSSELPGVGDWVCVRRLDDRAHASIHAVLQHGRMGQGSVAGTFESTAESPADDLPPS
jgi:ribosome biogenesis GTPase